jgi:hypothetical protein
MDFPHKQRSASPADTVINPLSTTYCVYSSYCGVLMGDTTKASKDNDNNGNDVDVVRRRVRDDDAVQPEDG